MSKVDILMDLDRQFCKESMVNKEQAWIKFTSNKLITGTPGDMPFLKEKDTFIDSIKELYNTPNLNFEWTPEIGFMSDDQTLGVTVGKYTREYTVNGEMKNQKGKYISVWKKINGEWKIILDMGN